MKIGDKLFCYKKIDFNEKNSYYTILGLTNNTISITTEKDPAGVLLTSRNFYINTKIDRWSKMSDHFITLEECRKQKLKKLESL